MGTRDLNFVFVSIQFLLWTIHAHSSININKTYLDDITILFSERKSEDAVHVHICSMFNVHSMHNCTLVHMRCL